MFDWYINHVCMSISRAVGKCFINFVKKCDALKKKGQKYNNLEDTRAKFYEPQL